MKVNDSKEDILVQIEKRQVFDPDNFNAEKEQEAIIQIAAEELHERLDEEYRMRLGNLPDEIWSRECEYITEITHEILQNHYIPMKIAILKAKISNRENEISKQLNKVSPSN